MTVSLVALLVFGSNPWLVALAVLGVGLFGMGMGPSIQYRVVSLAGPGAPLASSLPASAVNAGIAFGAFAGGIAIDGGGVPFAVVTGIAIAVAASPPHGRPVSCRPPSRHPCTDTESLATR